ncbi:MAG TPA: hypothetical protein VGN49_06200 [Micrococcaceae bacterium]|nr:hypothetical protein [Micrococcaceae bacterium]
MRKTHLSVTACALVLGAGLASGLTGCSATAAPGAPGSQDGKVVVNKPATDVLKQFTGSVSDTLSHAGGAWTYRSQKPWDAGNAADFSAHDCGQVQRAWQYSVSLVGPAVKDADAAVKKMAEHWKSQGAQVGGEGGWDAIPSSGVAAQKEISAVTRDGIKFTYDAGTDKSRLASESVCSTNPDMTAAGS